MAAFALHVPTRLAGAALGLALGAAVAGLAAELPAARAAAVEPASVEVLTTRENASIPKDMLVVRVTGPILPPVTETFSRAVKEHGNGFDVLLLELDSAGGEFRQAERFAELLARLGQRFVLKTYVRHGGRCLSACVLLFMQGVERYAASSSVWLFHGVCLARQERPSPLQTQRFLDLLTKAGVSDKFVCDMVERGYFTEPGEFWASGYELFHIYKSNIITHMIEPWRPR